MVDRWADYSWATAVQNRTDAPVSDVFRVTLDAALDEQPEPGCLPA